MSTMNIYQFALPLKTNDGRGDYAAQLTIWEELVLDTAGGFTALGDRRGVWRSDDGIVYDETMRGYQVAVDNRAQRDALIEHAKALFPDQLAFYVAWVGDVEIVSNAQPEPLVPRREPCYAGKLYVCDKVGGIPRDGRAWDVVS